MLYSLWKAIRTAAWVVAVFFSLVAFVELAHAYQVLRDVHPAVGYGFVGLIVVGGAWLIIRYVTEMSRRPSVLTPPARRDAACYGRYLSKAMRRLAANPNTDAPSRERIRAGLEQLDTVLRRRAGEAQVLEAIRSVEETAVRPCVDTLNAKARAHVRACVRDVMIGVTLSPWRSADLIVVVYRNLGMVAGITRTYDARPRLREQLGVMRDVLTVVATVNILNYGSRLFQNLTAMVPGLGRFTDDVAQGIGAGLLTSMMGHATMQRCTAYRGWDEAEVQKRMREKVQEFLADIKGIIFEDILPPLNLEFGDKVRDGISSAVDRTAAMMDLFICQPVVVAGKGAVGVGAALVSGVGATGRTIVRGGAATGRLMVQVPVVTAKGVWQGAAAGGRLARRTTRFAWRGVSSGAGKITKAVLPRRRTDETGDNPSGRDSSD